MRLIAIVAATAVLAAASSAPGSAHAAVLVATWKGTVGGLATNFTSRLGFGVLESLLGRGFEAQFVYNSDLGRIENANPGEGRLGGDSLPFGPGPVSSAWLQIEGGNKITLNPHTRSQLRSKTGAFTTMNVQELTGAAGLDEFSLNAFHNASGNLDTTLPLTAVTGTGAFQFASFNPAFGFDTVDASGGLQVTSLYITEYVAPTPGSAAPEPAAWALLIAGFGAVGATLRRRPAVA